VFERLPIFTKGRKSEATDVYLFTSGAVSATSLTLTQGTDTVTFEDSPSTGGGTKSFVAHDVRRPMSDWQVKIGDLNAKIETLWLVARYTLK
jgi:hypothetical protein